MQYVAASGASYVAKRRTLGSSGRSRPDGRCSTLDEGKSTDEYFVNIQQRKLTNQDFFLASKIRS